MAQNAGFGTTGWAKVRDGDSAMWRRNPMRPSRRQPPGSGVGGRCATYFIASTLSRMSRASASLSRGTRTLHQKRKLPLSSF